MRAAVVIAAGTLATVQIGNASVIEIMWTLTGLVGIYITWSNLKDSRKYVTALRRMNGTNLKAMREMRIIAFGHYRNEVLRIALFGIIIAVGVAAMITPPATSNQKITPVSIAITIGLLAITAILVAASFLDRRQRDLMMEEYDLPEN